MDVVARAALVTLFLVSAASKVYPRGEFAWFVSSLGRFGLRSRRTRRAAAVLVVGCELAVAAVAAAVPFYGEVLGAVLLTVLTGALIDLRRKGDQSCNCFGSRSSGPVVEHIVLNVALIGVCVAGALDLWSTSAPGMLAVQLAVGAAVGLLHVTADLVGRIVAVD
jgi:hypothetical protein